MNVVAKAQREGFVEPEKREEAIKPAMPPPEIAPSPEDLPPLAQDEWPIVVKLLYKGIRNNAGETVRTISLREPRAADINRFGNPVRVNQDGDVVIDERKMTYIISALAGILPPFIEDMDPRDWNSCAYRLRRFFLPDPAAW
jgi:hypothetical protein